MQNQLVCGGCRSIILCPRGAPSVWCAICNTFSRFPPPGMEMLQLICGGCGRLLLYTSETTIVRCFYCHAMNLAPASNQVAHINCRNCQMNLMYPYGVPSLKCPVCQDVTFFDRGNARIPLPANRPNVTVDSGAVPHASTVTTQSQSQTVLIENPMSVNESGKLVSNVVVGVAVATGNKQQDSR